MNRLAVAVAQSLVLVMFSGAPPLVEDDEALKKDLTAVIALHGLPCGQVIAATALAESDYAATCKDGNKYRVYLNTAGRVVVEAQK
jgi:hypothetical protein